MPVGNAFSRSHEVLPLMANVIGRERGLTVEKKEAVSKSKNSDLVWYDSSKGAQKTSSDLLHLSCVRTATFLEYRSLAAYPVHVMRLNNTAMQRMYSIDHVYTLVGFLAVESGAVETARGSCTTEMSLSLHGFLSAEVVPLESFSPQS